MKEKKDNSRIKNISLIILNYNGFEETEKLTLDLCSWDKDILEYHIIIVDNCSTDGSYMKLKKKFSKKSQVDVICTEYNGGYSYGNNYGVKFALKKYRPEYIAICNPDIILNQEMLLQLLKTFDVDEKIGMCAPIMKMPDGYYSIHAITLPTFEDDLRSCSLRNNPQNVNRDHYQTIDDEKNLILTEMLPGSFFVIKSDVFLKIGMFDDKVFLYCEERIIGNKLKQAGYLAVTRADLFFIHAHAVTVRKSLSTIKSQKILWKSRLYYQKKYNGISGVQALFLHFRSNIYICKLTLLLGVNKIRQRGMAKCLS